MPIPLGGNTGTSAINLKLPNVGDYVDIAIVDKEQLPEKDMVTGQPKLKDNGKPKMQLRLTALYQAGSGPGLATQGDEVLTPGVDDVVTLYLSGHKFGAWIDAEKEHGLVNVGDLCRVTFTHTEKAKTRGFHDAKIWSVQLKANVDQALVSRCEEAYTERQRSKGTSLGQTTPAPNADEEPF